MHGCNVQKKVRDFMERRAKAFWDVEFTDEEKAKQFIRAGQSVLDVLL